MIKTLVGIRLRALVSSMKSTTKGGTKKTASVGNILLFAFLYLFIAVTFIGLFTVMAIGMASTFIPLGYEAMYLGSFSAIAFSFVFIFSIFETKSELFDCKDNELLLAFPIKPSDIVVSRILTVLVYNYVEAAIIMIPCIVCYVVFGGSVFGVIGSILVFLLVPLFATALSSGVGYVVAALARKIKKNSFVTTAVSLVFLIAYFVVYFGFIGNMGADEEMVIVENKALSFIGKIALLHPILTPVFAVLSLGTAYLAYHIISTNYTRIASYKDGAKRVEYKASASVQKSAVSALVRKELRKFFSSSAYMLNSALGSIFAVFLAVVALINKAEIVGVTQALGIPGLSLTPVFISAVVLTTSMNMQSASALSLEGKSLWILKSMPISAREVLIAKTLPHIIVSTPPTLISSVLMIIASDAEPVYWIFFLLTPFVTNVLFAIIGTVLNVAFPKFDFINEAQPIKQSLPVFLIMLISMVWTLVIIGANFLLSILGLGVLVAALTLVLTLIVAGVMLLILLGPSAKKYDKI